MYYTIKLNNKQNSKANEYTDTYRHLHYIVIILYEII